MNLIQHAHRRNKNKLFLGHVIYRKYIHTRAGQRGGDDRAISTFHTTITTDRQGVGVGGGGRSRHRLTHPKLPNKFVVQPTLASLLFLFGKGKKNYHEKPRKTTNKCIREIPHDEMSTACTHPKKRGHQKACLHCGRSHHCNVVSCLRAHVVQPHSTKPGLLHYRNRILFFGS